MTIQPNRFQRLWLLSITTFLLLGCAKAAVNLPSESPSATDRASAPSPVNSAPVTPVSSPAAVAQSPKAIASRSGRFVSGEHETKGTARIVMENGKAFVVLDQNFATSSLGPDLYVILHRSAEVLKTTQPPAYPIKEQDYAIVGRLQKYSGSQRYAIPANLKPDDFKSIVIWCRQFNATFGAAPLK